MNQLHDLRSIPVPTPVSDLDTRPALASAFATATRVVAAVERDQLAAPTPCEGMDVRRLLGHLIMVGQRVACAGRGDDLTAWPGEITGLADDRWLPAWEATIAPALDAWADDAQLTEPVALPWGTFPGFAVIGTYTNEVVVHTWDLAQATGHVPTWDPRAVEVATEAIRAQLPDADRRELWAATKAELPPGAEWEDPFGPAVPVSDDAPAIDRLVAWNGRTP